MKVIEAPLEAIEVGERRRADYGDIGALAKGIKRVGLLEPIIVDRIGRSTRYRLVAGERRLKAVQMLKWASVPAHLLEELSDADLRDIELEENENRKSLTDRERQRTFKAAKKETEKQDKAREVLNQSDSKPQSSPKGGRPTEPASTRAVASALGTSQMSVVRDRQHVETAERFPFMQGVEWRQSDVLRMRERLEELPDAEQNSAAGVLSCAKLLDPAQAVSLVEKIAAKKPEERQEVYRLSQSEDPRERSLALTKAAELPPMPDPRLGIIDNACHILGAAIKPYPADPLTPRISSIRDELRRVRAEVKTVSFDAQQPQQKGAIQ